MKKWQELEDHSRKASDNALRKAMKKGMFGSDEPKKESKPTTQGTQEEKKELTKATNDEVKV